MEKEIHGIRNIQYYVKYWNGRQYKPKALVYINKNKILYIVKDY